MIYNPKRAGFDLKYFLCKMETIFILLIVILSSTALYLPFKMFRVFCHVRYFKDSKRASAEYRYTIEHYLLIVWDLVCIGLTIFFGSLIGNSVYHDNPQIQASNSANGLTALELIATQIMTIYIFVMSFAFGACISKIATVKSTWKKCLALWCTLALEVDNAQTVKDKGNELLRETKIVALKKRQNKSHILIWLKDKITSTVNKHEQNVTQAQIELLQHFKRNNKSFADQAGNSLIAFINAQHDAHDALSTTILPYTVAIALYILLGSASAALTVYLKIEFVDESEMWVYHVCYFIMTFLYLPLFAAYHVTPQIGSIWQRIDDSLIIRARLSIEQGLKPLTPPTDNQQPPATPAGGPSMARANSYRSSFNKIDI